MRRLLRLLISLLLIALVIWQLDETALWQQLRHAQPLWLLAAAGLLTLQILISAWRWRYTAAQLGMTLTGSTAIREYYLAVLVNQVLPGGVIGDAQRAWRHSGQLARRSPAFQAVIIERFSGQIAMVALALGAWWLMPVIPLPTGTFGASLGGIAVLAAVFGIFIWILHRQARLADWLQALQAALLNPPVFAVQLLASLLAAIACVAAYACCVMALGTSSSDSLTVWLPLIPLVLFTMLIPITVAGWGLREGAAGMLWVLVALPVAEGVAAAMLFGGVALFSSLPGVFVILRRGNPI